MWRNGVPILCRVRSRTDGSGDGSVREALGDLARQAATAHAYHIADDWKDDAMAKGKAIHPSQMTSFGMAGRLASACTWTTMVRGG
jgi:hypothetical protein